MGSNKITILSSRALMAIRVLLLVLTVCGAEMSIKDPVLRTDEVVPEEDLVTILPETGLHPENQLVQDHHGHLTIDHAKIQAQLVEPETLCTAIMRAWDKHKRGAKLCSAACAYLTEIAGEDMSDQIGFLKRGITVTVPQEEICKHDLGTKMTAALTGVADKKAECVKILHKEQS